MNVQELLTYVEELAFKTSMFGYDKDEVDIQLDKICDEVEAMMAEKEKTIQALKSGIPVESVQESFENEKTKQAEKEKNTPSEENAQQAEDLKILEGVYKTEKKELEEQIAKLTKELRDSKDQLLAVQTELEEKKTQLADAGESLDDAIARAEMAEERAEAIEKALGEKQNNELTQTRERMSAAQTVQLEAEKPETKDEAYQQYLRNADLLCRQLADLQNRQDSIVEKAKAEAKNILDSANAESAKILDCANTEASQMVNSAKEKLEKMNQESEDRIKEAAAKAKKIRKNSQFRVSQEQKRYDALVEKKNNLVEYFGAITADIQQLVEKVQLPIKEMTDVSEENTEEMD